MRFLANFLYHAWWGGCQSNGLKNEKNVFLGGVQSKSQEKVRKNEKSENKKLIN